MSESDIFFGKDTATKISMENKHIAKSISIQTHYSQKKPIKLF